MKLQNLWSQNLSVGLAIAACVSPAWADGMSPGGNTFKPASFASVKQDAINQSTVNQRGMGLSANPNYIAASYAEMASQNGGYPETGSVSSAAYQMPGSDPSCECSSIPGGECDSMGCGPEGSCSSCMEGGGPCSAQCGPGCPCPFGMGLASRLGNGCGPLGCNGGTFGDGRSVRSLFGGCQGRLYGLLAGVMTPYGEGGVASQRWFDLSAEVTAFRREKGAGLTNFTSQGRGTGNYVLSSNSVDLDNFQAGLALQANVQCGPGSNLEGIYFGLNKWNESASASSTPANSPSLYSFLSNFGTNPFNGFDDPDRSFLHTLNYKSAFNNGEFNFRRRWVEPSGFLQGSFLAGVRYFQLDETLVFSARGENNNTAANNGLRFFDYEAATKNQLTGFQSGGDLWLNVIPGVKVGTELKAGIFGNHAVQNTRIFANSLGSGSSFGIPGVTERASDGRTAYLTQFSLSGIYRLTYSWTLRSSYQLIYVDNVALAPENINSQPPGLFTGNQNQVRNVRINNDAEVTYTGFTFGTEYLW